MRPIQEHKKQFVRKYQKLFDNVPSFKYPSELKDNANVKKIVVLARKEIGYSDKTYWLDIFWGLYKASKSADTGGG